MKHIFTAFIFTFFTSLSFGQFNEKRVEGEPKNIDRQQSISLDVSIPSPANQNKGRISTFDPTKKQISLPSFVNAQKRPKLLQTTDWGVPSWIAGPVKAHENRTFTSPEEAAIAYLEKNMDVLPFRNAQSELNVLQVEDEPELSLTHVKIQQSHQGVDVFGGEVWVHLKSSKPQSMTGRMYPVKRDLPSAHLRADQAFEAIKSHFSKDWKSEALDIDGYHVEQYAARLNWYPMNDTKDVKLAYVADVYPDFLHKHFIVLDAVTGEVIDTYLSMCYFHGGPGHHHAKVNGNYKKTSPKLKREAGGTSHSQMMGDELSNGLDLFGINRSFRTILENGTYFMVDISRPMFNTSSSSLPSNPVGGIRTYNGLNNPINSSFNYSQITSSNNSWSNPASVSAHYNAGEAYDYFRTTFNRNSINGSGGTITSFIHVNDENSQAMDNAFWNGEAMFYGDGSQAFFSLARGLDVAGHEISHGVVQNSANLNYQNESGALNESFADIFGSMIDREDWLIGEDVVRTSAFPTGALRSMIDPTQGLSSNQNGYQPGHYSTRYTGSQDRGGVHINSGIPNKAFYLFATAIGKTKAEQVYYRALTTYLTRSSTFSDCRASVMQAAKDLYGNTECDAAATAFDQVGISGSTCGGGGPVVPTDNSELAANPGADLIIYVNSTNDRLAMIDGAGTPLVDPFTDETPLSKPSVSDDGSRIVFINSRNKLHLISIDWGASEFTDEELTTNESWRNVSISKDGLLIAATTSAPQNAISVFELSTGTGLTFPLTNPTTGGVATGDVVYSDAMEFDYSGEYVLYDALNEISGTNENIQYWDIGILRAWDKNTSDFGDGQISKIFSGLPEGISVGNPTLSKTKPNVIAYDVVEAGFFNDDYFLYASNIETNTTALVYDNPIVSYPTYSRTDDRILFNAQNSNDDPVVGQNALMVDRVSPSGDPSIFLNDAYWATWFSNGTRNINVGLQEKLINDFVEIAPNPAIDNFSINLGQEAGTLRGYRIYNAAGTTITQGTVDADQSVYAVNTRDIASGNYLLEINSTKGKAIKQIIIQH